MKPPSSKLLWGALVALAGVLAFLSQVPASEAQSNLASWWELITSLRAPNWLSPLVDKATGWLSLASAVVALWEMWRLTRKGRD